MSTTTTEPSGNLIPYFPDEISLNILARVPRSNHRLLSQVSRSFNALISSSLFYTTRSLLRTSETCLHLAFRNSTTCCVQWFTLLLGQRNPSLLPLSLAPYRIVSSSASLALGHKIYVIGGCTSEDQHSSFGNAPSQDMWTLDCRSHRWERSPVPSNKVLRKSVTAFILDGKIFVGGRMLVLDRRTGSRPMDRYEVFDPETQKWESFDGSSAYSKSSCEKLKLAITKCNDVGGNIFYALAGNDWDSGGWSEILGNGVGEIKMCVLDGVLYDTRYVEEGIQGFDLETGVMKVVRWVESEPPKFHGATMMVNVGGQLVVVWVQELRDMHRKERISWEVWCAKIAVDKKEDGELWGKVESFDVVYKAPYGEVNNWVSLIKCMAVTL